MSLDAERKTDKTKKDIGKNCNKQYPEKVMSCDCREEKMLKVRFQFNFSRGSDRLGLITGVIPAGAQEMGQG